MDPSNRKFTNQNDEPSNPTDTRHDSPPQQLPNNFIPSQFPQSLNPQYFPNLYPFGGPANYPPYGHSPPTFQGLQHQGKWAPSSFQGYHLQENLVSSPNQGHGANTSSHGSESSTPCAARHQEKKSVSIEELSDSSEEEEEENLRLLFAWLNNSVDSVKGNDKKQEYYWKDVASEFNSNRPTDVHMRIVKQLKTHWGTVKREIAKFCGVYANVRATYTSGHSDDMIMEKSHAWYKSQSSGKPFTLEYMWRELKDQPKWRTVVKKELGKNKRTKISESGAYTSSSTQDTEEESASKERRPEGQKKAKERLKGKGKGTLSSPLGNPPSQNIVLYNETIKIRAEALLKSAEAQVESAKAKWEETRMKKWLMYIQLEERDTSNLSPQKLK
ncbi:hypothetical protein PVAP13_2KG195200, partial [Panicum virgatum]